MPTEIYHMLADVRREVHKIQIERSNDTIETVACMLESLHRADPTLTLPDAIRAVREVKRQEHGT